MKISVWKAIGMAGLLAEELTKAGVDGKITFDEAIVITRDLAATAGLAFDDKGINVIVKFVTDFAAAMADGVITINEVVTMIESACNELGVDFDKTGFNVA